MKVVDSFTIGGVNGHPSMPGKELQNMLGRVIQMNVQTRTLYVPTKRGIILASTGDHIVLYDDGSLDVVKE